MSDRNRQVRDHCQGLSLCVTNRSRQREIIQGTSKIILESARQAHLVGSDEDIHGTNPFGLSNSIDISVHKHIRGIHIYVCDCDMNR